MTGTCDRCDLRYDHEHCVVCDRPFIASNKPGEPTPVICGFAPCRAQHDWDPEEWAGRARMATARRAAGRISRRGPLDKDGNRPIEWDPEPLDDIDREALQRAGLGAA